MHFLVGVHVGFIFTPRRIRRTRRIPAVIRKAANRWRSKACHYRPRSNHGHGTALEQNGTISLTFRAYAAMTSHTILFSEHATPIPCEQAVSMLDPRRVIHREIHPQASNASPDLKRTPTDGLSTPPVPPEFHYITTCSVSGRLMKDNIFETISPNEALEIIRRLAKTDKVLKEKIVELAENLIRAVDVDEVCECVFDALDCIDVHELWDRAGPNRDGYTSPEEMSFEMFEEAIAPYIKEMHRLLDLKMHREAKLYNLNSKSKSKSVSVSSRTEAQNCTNRFR
jgi:hypothetical protein